MSAECAQRELKRITLEWPKSVARWNRQAESLEIEEMDGILEILQESSNHWLADPWRFRSHGLDLSALILRQREFLRDLDHPCHPALKQCEAFCFASVKLRDVVFREKCPAASSQGTLIRTVAMRADRDLRTAWFADRSLHLCQAFFNRPAKLAHFPRAVLQQEQLLRLKFSMPDVVAMQVEQEAAAKLETCPSINIRLEGDVFEVHILGFSNSLHFVKIPATFHDRHQNVGACKRSLEDETRLKQWPAHLQGQLAGSLNPIGVYNAGSDFDPTWKKASSNCADFAPLIVDGLKAAVRRWDQIARIEAHPKMLLALQPPKESRFRNHT